MKNERKLARVKFPVCLLQQLLKAEEPLVAEYMKSNAPKDLEVLGVRQEMHDYLNGNFEIYMHSDSFEEVPDGKEPPFIEPFIITDTRMNSLEDDK